MAMDEQAWPFCFRDEAKANVVVRVCHSNLASSEKIGQGPLLLVSLGTCWQPKAHILWNSQLCVIVNLHCELCEI